MEKVTFALDDDVGAPFEVNLTKEQVGLISQSVTSAPVCNELVYIGLSHGALKHLRDGLGDLFTRHTYKAKERRTDNLVGPTRRIEEQAARAITFNTTRKVITCSCGGGDFHQADTPWNPPCWTDGSYEERVEPVTVHAVYDPYSVCFVSNDGRTLLISRTQLNGYDFDF